MPTGVPNTFDIGIKFVINNQLVNNFIDIVKQKSDDELLVMIYQFAEWSPEMLKAVEVELVERKIFPDDISSMKRQMIEDEDIILTQGKQASLFGQVVGWIGVFGLLGMFMGYYYAYSKVRSKYINKEYLQYNEYSRNIGRWLFYISIIVTSIFIVIRTVKWEELR